MKKEGFTLVELLAVIAILAILVVIALPNVLDMFNSAKQNTFATEVQTVLKTAQQQYVLDSGSYKGYTHKTTCGTNAKEMKLSGEPLIFKVVFGDDGKVISLNVVNSSKTFRYDYPSDGLYTAATPGLQIQDIIYNKTAISNSTSVTQKWSTPTSSNDPFGCP